MVARLATERDKEVETLFSAAITSATDLIRMPAALPSLAM
jgi:hypothetical protein